MQIKEFVSHGIPVTQVQVETEQDVKVLDRAQGRYVTLELGPLTRLVDFEGACACLVEQLKPMLEPCFGKPLCVCGMGNQNVPSDCLGPETARRFQPHMYSFFTEKSNFKKIAVVCPGTSALTNLATETIISGIVSGMDAACVVVVDSSATKDAKSLCATVHLTDSGIKRQSKTAYLCQATVGVPVIAVVVPTSLSAAAPSDAGTGAEELLLAPVQVADTISIASFMIACAIAQIAYPELDYESCKQYIGLVLHGVI